MLPGFVAVSTKYQRNELKIGKAPEIGEMLPMGPKTEKSPLLFFQLQPERSEAIVFSSFRSEEAKTIDDDGGAAFGFWLPTSH